ncbi:MAG: hypothetical protein AB9846_14035 [Tenuifilaceae bacterium]
MKKNLEILIILLFFSILSYAQNVNIKETKVIRINDGDSTFIARLFEININKKDAYVINPVMNYLDIKGGKQKYPIEVTKENWNIIENLLLEINFSDYEKVAIENNRYSITLFFEDTKGNTYTTRVESELVKLKKIIRILRE